MMSQHGWHRTTTDHGGSNAVTVTAPMAAEAEAAMLTTGTTATTPALSNCYEGKYASYYKLMHRVQMYENR